MKQYEIYFLFLLGLFLVTGCSPDIKKYCDFNEECIEGYLCNQEKKCVAVEQEELQIIIGNIPVGTTGEEYNFTFFVNGGLKPYYLNISTELEWLTYNEQSNDGIFYLSGVPNEQVLGVLVDLEVTDNTIGNGQKVTNKLSLSVLPTSCNPIVFNDSALEAKVRLAIDKETGDILHEDILSLTELNTAESTITDLGGIQCLTNLTWLSLDDNQISDISPLANLISLTELGFSGNQIIDISPLANLTNLTELGLSDNQISDISPLANLTNLTELGLYENQISDISVLANLTNLTKLYLHSNQISDIGPLANLTNLTGLYLRSNQIIDISPLANLTKLTNLYLSSNQIIDISILANMTNLTDLWLNENQIIDISILANMTNLTDLWLHANQIINISPLANLTNLTDLYLRHNQIIDISSLVDNIGINSGDVVDITDNPQINCTDQADNISDLRARGVDLDTDCP